MKRTSRSSRRAAAEHSTWQSLGEIALPAGFDPHQSDFPSLQPVLQDLMLSTYRQRQIERAVCDAIRNAWESLQKTSLEKPFAIRVFCQSRPASETLPAPASPQQIRTPASSWGFFLITNLEAEPNSVEIRRTVDLFLYPEG